jgi:hypothetical protein
MRGFEVFTVVKIQLEVFWVVVSCSVVVGFHNTEDINVYFVCMCVHARVHTSLFYILIH